MRNVTHSVKGNTHFLSCSCGFYHRIGIPCGHIFLVTNLMDLAMFHIRHWKLYSACYGDGSKLGKYMQEAQDQHFRNEGMGCVVPSDSLNLNDVNDVLIGDNTTLEDWQRAQYVMSRCKNDCCSWSDMSNQFNGTGPGEVAETFKTYRDHQQMLSPVAARLQKELQDAHTTDLKSGIELCFDNDESIEMELHTLRKTGVGAIDDVLKCDDIPLEVKDNFIQQIQQLKINAISEYASNITRGGSTYEFPVTEVARGKNEEKRKKNVAG